MFVGFPEETIRFFLDLRFHNNAAFFHEQHDRYIQTVQTPFYDFIRELAPVMQEIDPLMEVRPHKCLSRIHRDTRFSRDKSPYRDHLWISFRRAAEIKDGSLNFWFELGPDNLSWGMGSWGENKPLCERFRREMVADPMRIAAVVDRCDLAGHHLALQGSCYKRMSVPETLPQRLRPWYVMRDFYIPRTDVQRAWVFTERIAQEVRRDFVTLAPIYRMLRGMQDDVIAQERALARQEHAQLRQDEW